MEGRRRIVCGATQTIGLLAFIYLFYNQLFGFDPVKHYSGTVNLVQNVTMEEDIVLEDSLQPLFKSLIGDDNQRKLETTGLACDSTFYSSVCVASNPVKINTKTMEIYMGNRLSSTTNGNNNFDKEEENLVVEVRPYAWTEFDLLKSVTPVKFLHEPPLTHAGCYCNYNHTVPAVVFSSGGFSGNLFHEFNEIIIPLYTTTHGFRSRVQFIMVDYNPSFLKKYQRVLSSLSRYNVMNQITNTSVHCFPGVVAGLKRHDNYLAINSSDVPRGNSISEFRKFLKSAYHLKITNVSNTAPVLLLVSRQKTRVFLNEDELVDMMQELGFHVVVVRSAKQMSDLERFAKLVSTCSVMVGAHGAGLTNLVFLPPRAVVVQVVPLGLDWTSMAYFGEPAVQMGLHYLDYKIGPDESSLIDLYAHDDPVISDPGSIFAKGYFIGREVYLDKQNIRIDINRFKSTLVEALRLLEHTTPLSTR